MSEQRTYRDHTRLPRSRSELRRFVEKEIAWRLYFTTPASLPSTNRSILRSLADDIIDAALEGR